MTETPTRRRTRAALAILAPLMLSGCLEVEQHPAWRDGAYDGKPDPLPSQAWFHGDPLAWNARITDRNHLQDEYGRAKP
jgi:hypothetical protein